MQSTQDIYKIARILDGVPVLGCIPGSPSHRCGVRRGDIIMSANGQRVRDLQSYFLARRERRDGLTVVVFRGGEEIELEMELGEPLTTERVVAYFEEQGTVMQSITAMSSAGDPEDIC